MTVAPHYESDIDFTDYQSTKATLVFDRREWRLVTVERGPVRRVAPWLGDVSGGTRVELPASIDRGVLLDELLCATGLRVGTNL